MEFESSVNSDETKATTMNANLTPQDLLDKMNSLVETMSSIQTQLDDLKLSNSVSATVLNTNVESQKEVGVSSEEAWESLFK